MSYPDALDTTHPASPEYRPSKWDRVLAAQEARERRFRTPSDTVEAYADWLSEVWDHVSHEADDDLIAKLEAVRDALGAALAPWRGEIIAHYRKQRRDAKHPPRDPLTLFDVTLPKGDA
ncbi:MAG: hypothetical protein K2X74_00600 [Acetobacteraceae bacterium]|nr:hypothetical protein [Acetobacteraceae bacterium]